MSSKTILLVDDEQPMRQLVAEFLRGAGYLVLEAGSGGEAMQLVRETGSLIDLLLTDMMMPGMNGRQLAELLAAKHPAVRVLFITGYSGEEIACKGVLEERTALLGKPFTIGALLGKVATLLRENAKNFPD